MESYAALIYQSGLKLFTLKNLHDVLRVANKQTFFRAIERLVSLGVLNKIEKSKYSLGVKINSWLLANFLYSPSYLSLETALNFYGILSQFPYEITSVTSKKPLAKTVDKIVYSYSHLAPSLFWGYTKLEEYLIAEPEKALLDQLYLYAKGLRGFNFDEYDYHFLNRQKFKKYLSQFPKTRQFQSAVKKLRKFYRL